MMQARWAGIFLALLGISMASVWAQQGDSSEAIRQEEVEDYYKKWLEEDVRYIITDEERAVFSELSTPEEREQFIEQFWFRRDPDPRTVENEFKEEHYRRIAYANEKFTSGDPGWMTDRGRVYILHGEPDSIVSRPMGGAYQRTMAEGGGITSVYPYEKWRYRHIEGMGNDVELEFVDPSNSGEYKLAVFDWEKDALMMVPGAGKTLAEATGLSTRADRPALIPGAGGSLYGPQNWYRSVRDTPFHRYEQFANVGAVPITKYKDLKEMVEINIQYANLPMEVKEEYFKLNENQVLVPVTVKLENQDLSFETENELSTARVAVYGIVTSLTNRVITEFEEDFTIRYKPEELTRGLRRASAYQRIIPLDKKTRYKIDLVVKDLNSGKSGVIRKAIIPPEFEAETLTGSSLLLSDQVEPLGNIPEDNPMFVLGDVRVLPNMEHRFTSQMPLGVYFQVYNAGLDQSTLQPSLRVTYSLLQNGEVLKAATDTSGESTQFFSGTRVVLMKHLSLDGLEPGQYQLQIEVEDQLTNQKVSQVGGFTVVSEDRS